MRSRPLVPVLLSTVGGILIGHLGFPRLPFPASYSLLVFGLPVLLLLVSILFLPGRSRFPMVLVLFFGAGLFLDLEVHRFSELRSVAETGKEVTVEGTVLEPVRISGDTARMTVRADRVAGGGVESQPHERILVTVYSHARRFSPGDRVLFPARLRPFKNFHNPGGYDQETAMALKGFACAGSASDGRLMVPLGKGNLGLFAGALEAVRSPLRTLFCENLAPQQRALFSALILGETQDIRPEWREPFTSTGLGHVLVVSGLHVGLIAWVCFCLFRRLLSLSYRLTLSIDIRKAAALLTSVPVVGYALLAGFQLSSQRAMIMVLAYLLSRVLEREREVWSTFSLAALAVLAMDPHAVLTPSFQLSFGAVIGLLWLAPEMYKWLERGLRGRLGKGSVGDRFARYALGLVAATFSASLFLLPVVAYYFHRISLVGLPANLMALPILALWILPLGLLAAVNLALSSFLAALFLEAASWGLDAMLIFIEFWAGVPWAEVWVVTPNLLEMGIFYGLITCLLLLRKGKWSRVGLVVLMVGLAGDVSYWVHRTIFNPSLKVTYLDVGQGSAALIQFPGKEKMLIDGGGALRDDFDMGRMVIAPFLLGLKIRCVDYLVLSHPEADHMGGLRFVAAHFRPREFWHNGDRPESESFRELMEIVREKGIKQYLPSDLREGRLIAGVRIDLLHPGDDGDHTGLSGRPLKRNDRSLVLKLTYGGTSFLFPGDLEREGESVVIAREGPRLRSNVLLAPHHGSGGSCSSAFLAEVSPRFCVISSRSWNPLRFPHPDSLQRLQEAGCMVFRTDRVGAVSFSTQGEGLEIQTFLRDPLKRPNEGHTMLYTNVNTGKRSVP